MSKYVKQFKFYGDKNDNNFPPATLDGYENGTVFNKVYPILQLGIQGLPGTKFYLNGSIYPIYIGATGVYDLEVKNGLRINKIEFDHQSLGRYSSTNTSEPVLIVDVIYEKKEA